MRDELLQIINHYGLQHQIRKFSEETFELQEALILYMASPDIMKLENIKEELADVIVLLKQFKNYFDIKDIELELIEDFKIERQLKRIENGDK